MDGPGAGEPWVHFRTDMSNPARALFTHWYTFFLFEDYATDLFMKRLVRDYVHYDERVSCHRRFIKCFIGWAALFRGLGPLVKCSPVSEPLGLLRRGADRGQA